MEDMIAWTCSAELPLCIAGSSSGGFQIDNDVQLLLTKLLRPRSACLMYPNSNPTLLRILEEWQDLEFVVAHTTAGPADERRWELTGLGLSKVSLGIKLCQPQRVLRPPGDRPALELSKY